MSIKFQPDHYYLYDEMVQLLEAWVQQYPDLLRYSSIGVTGQGREIPCLEITAHDAIRPEEKTGYLINGNLHGAEVISSTAVLSFVDDLLCRYAGSEELQQLLKTVVIYAIPRINCDGSELCLTTPYWARGSANPYFPAEDGVYAEDINGDGEILKMRIPDPNGAFKCSPLDSRLMVPRGPGDTQGPFYSVFTEGLVRGDLHPLQEARPQRALDPNRAFPYNWSMDSIYVMQNGRQASGPYPLYEPEARALADFIVEHPNLVGVNDCHSYGGIHISPLAFCPEREPLMEDAIAYGVIGGQGAAKTGYQVQGIFPPGVKDFIKGAFVPWAYYMYGIFAWTTEIWSFLSQSNPDRGTDRTPHDEQLPDQKLLLDWDDTVNHGEGFMPWTPFDHPQLGKVEIGGWRDKTMRYNPPRQFIPQECKKARDFTYLNLAALPRLEVSVTDCSRDGANYRLRIEVANVGYLPTSGSKMAETLNKAGPVQLFVTQGAHRRPAQSLGHLPGFGKVSVDLYVAGNPGDALQIAVKASKVCPASITYLLPDV